MKLDDQGPEHRAFRELLRERLPYGRKHLATLSHSWTILQAAQEVLADTKYENALYWVFDRLSVPNITAKELRETKKQIGRALLGNPSRATSYQPEKLMQGEDDGS